MKGSKMTKANIKIRLSKKNESLIINACELLEEKSQLTSDWNRIIKPSAVMLFDTMALANVQVKKKDTIYTLNRNVKEYNLFNTEQFKKEHMDLFEKFSSKNIRTNWTYEISEGK
jgi:hypothetical protein